MKSPQKIIERNLSHHDGRSFHLTKTKGASGENIFALIPTMEQGSELWFKTQSDAHKELTGKRNE